MTNTKTESCRDCGGPRSYNAKAGRCVLCHTKQFGAICFDRAGKLNPYLSAEHLRNVHRAHKARRSR